MIKHNKSISFAGVDCEMPISSALPSFHRDALWKAKEFSRAEIFLLKWIVAGIPSPFPLAYCLMMCHDVLNECRVVSGSSGSSVSSFDGLSLRGGCR